MSAEATFWAWMMGVKPSPCKLVLLCLADCHNSDNGRCDPSATYITTFTGLDRKTVFNALHMLVDMGLVTAAKRPGNSTQYHLLILENPIPQREKGERKRPVKVKQLAKKNQYHIRDYPDTGLPEFGTPGSTVFGTPGSTESGTPPVPDMGHEPTKNLPVKPTNEPTSSEAIASATRVAKPVDNFQSIAVDYAGESPEQAIFNRGVLFLGRYDIGEAAARRFLGKLKSECGVRRTLDAVVVALLSQPAGDPKGFLLGVLANQPRPMPGNWEPDPGVVSSLEGLGIPMSMIRDARDVFLVWFREMEIEHSDWPRLFRDWVIRDWELAEFKTHQYRANLAASAGMNYQKPFCEPAGGTL